MEDLARERARVGVLAMMVDDGGSKSPRGRVRLQEGMEEGGRERVNKGGL